MSHHPVPPIVCRRDATFANHIARLALGTAAMMVFLLVLGAGIWVVGFIGVALLVVLLDVAWLTRTLRRDEKAMGQAPRM